MSTLLMQMLDMAVPLHIQDIAKWSETERAAFRSESAEILATEGEALQHVVKGKTADLFNRLAKAIACLAYVPGGVNFGGRHWEVTLSK